MRRILIHLHRRAASEVSHLGVYLILKKDIIKFDIVTDILDIPGHLCPEGASVPNLSWMLDIFELVNGT